MVDDIINTEHMRNIFLIIGMTKDEALNAAQVNAKEFKTTASLAS